jgi:glutaredoxin 3
MARNVVVYTQQGCPPCTQAKEFLTRKGIAFTEKDIRQDPQAISELQRFGAMGTPVIVVDGTPVIGFNAPRIETLLARSEE